METGNLRLKQFINLYYDGSITKFCQTAKKKVPQISEITRGEQNIGMKLANQLQETTGINAAWLLTGQGDMIIEKKTIANQEPEKTSNSNVGDVISSGDTVRITDGKKVVTGIIERV